MKTPTPNRTFPLVLILVAAIMMLAILAGLLLPALAKAKAKAHRSSPAWQPRHPSWEASFDEPRPDRHAPPSYRDERYAPILEHDFQSVRQRPLSTFSIDVDTASYANIRRFINQGEKPPRDAVRVEEMINYFRYAYPPPPPPHPLGIHTEVSECPWRPEHWLARIGLQGRRMDRLRRPACNLVFLIDVSGSMEARDKLPLLVDSLKRLARELDAPDRIAIVVYSTSARVALPSTSASDQEAIQEALDNLVAEGSTNGGAGLDLAYRIASARYVREGVNRVILCTDGDFNVGVTRQGHLEALIRDKARTGVYLTVLGFGTGNYKDATLEALADLGNGNYAYIDSKREARKVLFEQASATLVTVAKDVKIQVEFNPAWVASYRLIGYENRALAAHDFNDDARDAGDLGAGHQVTALYELAPSAETRARPLIDPLKYQAAARHSSGVQTESGEIMTVKVRYKHPEGETSARLETPVYAGVHPFVESSAGHQLATAVAGFGMWLRDSPHLGEGSHAAILRWVEQAEQQHPSDAVKELADLIRSAQNFR